MLHSVVWKVSMVEFFAGKKAVTTAFQNSGLAVSPYEILDHCTICNFVGSTGFVWALLLCLSIEACCLRGVFKKQQLSICQAQACTTRVLVRI